MTMDISTKKLLCTLVHFVNNSGFVRTGFFGFLHAHDALAVNFFAILDQEISRCGQSLSDCILFASDDASVMAECHNSV